MMSNRARRAVEHCEHYHLPIVRNCSLDKADGTMLSMSSIKCHARSKAAGGRLSSAALADDVAHCSYVLREQRLEHTERDGSTHQPSASLSWIGGPLGKAKPRGPALARAVFRYNPRLGANSNYDDELGAPR